jgi:PAS domain S-box-containing protein
MKSPISISENAATARATGEPGYFEKAASAGIPACMSRKDHLRFNSFPGSGEQARMPALQPSPAIVGQRFAIDMSILALFCAGSVLAWSTWSTHDFSFGAGILMLAAFLLAGLGVKRRMDNTHAVHLSSITQRIQTEDVLRQGHRELELRVKERTADLTTANAMLVKQIIELGQVEASLRESEERYRELFENAQDAIYVHDIQGNYLSVNAAAERIGGYSRHEIIGRNFADFMAPEYAEWIRTNKLGGKGEKAYEIEMITKDGRSVPVEVSTRLIYDKGVVVGVQGIGRDITERKQALEVLRKLEVQLQQAQKLESIGQLAAGIAHEINTPTQYVSDNTRFLQDAFQDLIWVQQKYFQLAEACRAGSATDRLLTEVEALAKQADVDFLTQEIPKALGQALEGTERISKVVQSMKDFAHPGASVMQPCDLNKSIESTITVACGEWKYVAEMVTDFDTTLPLVPCLQGEFNQVVLNLIINAGHAIGDVIGEGSAGKGTITISTRHNGEWAEIRVSDTGTGISRVNCARIFDPFFTTKEVGKGTGQGLSISHNVVVEKHGGTITVETEEGVGTTFIIRLPLQATAQRPQSLEDTPEDPMNRKTK